MTNEEAINVLNDYDINFERSTPKEVAEAHEMAIKALEAQPSEDCISRKAVLDSLHRYFAEGFNEDRWWNSTHVLNAINKVPSIAPQPKEEPQPKTGHWVLSGGYWRCSECKEKALLKLDKATGGYREYEPVRSKYCPECGAKMQEVQK